MTTWISIRAKLVPYVRRGLRAELGYAAEHIANVMLTERLTQIQFDASRHDYNVALVLLGGIGPGDDRPDTDVELDLSLGPELVYRALHCRYQIEVHRLEVSELDEARRAAVRGELGELEELLTTIEKHIPPRGIAPSRRWPLR